MTEHDPPHRRRRNARSRRHIHRPSHRGAPQQTDPRYHSSCGAPRRVVRPRAAICQPGLPSSPGGATTARPCPRQPHLAGHLRLRRARIHTLNEQQGTRPVGVKPALSCDIEPGVFSWALSLTHTRTGGSPHYAVTNFNVRYTWRPGNRASSWTEATAAAQWSRYKKGRAWQRILVNCRTSSGRRRISFGPTLD